MFVVFDVVGLDLELNVGVPILPNEFVYCCFVFFCFFVCLFLCMLFFFYISLLPGMFGSYAVGLGVEIRKI